MADRLSSVYETHVYEAAEQAANPIIQAITHATPEERSASQMQHFLSVVDSYLNADEVDYSTQAYTWLAGVYYFLSRDNDTEMMSLVWEWVKTTIERGMRDEERFSLCYTFLFPIVDPPKKDSDVKQLLNLYDDCITRPYVQEAYSHHENGMALGLDLLQYYPHVYSS
ncbi:hypothetical protein [Schlesneria sp.]|uniref:hypothetical protein n=1 Tax=Schlesneria sp. TaxID=2762018 RepID=UPI002F121407